MKNKKFTHGGKREGAGRPKSESEALLHRSIRIPRQLQDAIQEMANEQNITWSKCVINLLTEHFDLE